jgi:hypothetical protein
MSSQYVYCSENRLHTHGVSFSHLSLPFQLVKIVLTHQIISAFEIDCLMEGLVPHLPQQLTHCDKLWT